MNRKLSSIKSRLAEEATEKYEEKIDGDDRFSGYCYNEGFLAGWAARGKADCDILSQSADHANYLCKLIGELDDETT